MCWHTSRPAIDIVYRDLNVTYDRRQHWPDYADRFRYARAITRKKRRRRRTMGYAPPDFFRVGRAALGIYSLGSTMLPY